MKQKVVFVLGLALLAVLIFQIIFQWKQTYYIWIEVPRMRLAFNSMSNIELKDVKDIGGADELEMWVTLQIKDKGRVVLVNPTYETFVKNDVPVSMLGIGDCLWVGGGLVRLPFKQIIDEYQALYEAAQMKFNSC